MTPIQSNQVRRRSQADEVLWKLRSAGELGCTNAELWTVAHAAHSRIAELRARGHRIRCVREAPGLYRYILEKRAVAKPTASEAQLALSAISTVPGSPQLGLPLFGEVQA